MSARFAGFDRTDFASGFKESRGASRSQREDPSTVEPRRFEVGQLVVQGKAGHDERIRRIGAGEQTRTGVLERAHEM